MKVKIKKTVKINKYTNGLITYAFVCIRRKKECLPMRSSILRTMREYHFLSTTEFVF